MEKNRNGHRGCAMILAIGLMCLPIGACVEEESHNVPEETIVLENSVRQEGQEPVVPAEEKQTVLTAAPEHADNAKSENGTEPEKPPEQQQKPENGTAEVNSSVQSTDNASPQEEPKQQPEAPSVSPEAVPGETAQPEPKAEPVSGGNTEEPTNPAVQPEAVQPSVPGTGEDNPASPPDVPGTVEQDPSSQPTPQEQNPQSQPAQQEQETQSQPTPQEQELQSQPVTQEQPAATEETGLSIRLFKSALIFNIGETVGLEVTPVGGIGPYKVTFIVSLNDEEVTRKTIATPPYQMNFVVDKGGKYHVDVITEDAAGHVTVRETSAPVTQNKRESRTSWERTMEEVELTGDFARDLVNIARTQIGYAESTENFIVGDEGTLDGYTRYGDFMGAPYAEWCASFVSFAVHYAQLPFANEFASANVGYLMEAARGLGAFHLSGEYEPKKGDIIFLETDGNVRGHMGIIEGVSGNLIQTIEGNVNNQVVEKAYYMTDDAITGFFSMQDMMQQYSVQTLEMEEVTTYGTYREPKRAMTNIGKVNVRGQATVNGAHLQVLEKKGTPVTVTGYANGMDGKTWYAVETDAVAGWIRGDLLVGEGINDFPEEQEEEQIVEEPEVEPEVLPEETAVPPAVTHEEEEVYFGDATPPEEVPEVAAEEETEEATEEVTEETAPDQPAETAEAAPAEAGDAEEATAAEPVEAELTTEETAQPAAESKPEEDSDAFFYDVRSGEEAVEERVVSGSRATARIREKEVLITWHVPGLVAVHDASHGDELVGFSSTDSCIIRGLEPGEYTFRLSPVHVDEENILIYEECFDTLTIRVD